jgi:hypothetical protein
VLESAYAASILAPPAPTGPAPPAAPHRVAWLTAEHVAPACRIIERGEERLDAVARRGGLGSAANLRERLRRATGFELVGVPAVLRGVRLRPYPDAG